MKEILHVRADMQTPACRHGSVEERSLPRTVFHGVCMAKMNYYYLLFPPSVHTYTQITLTAIKWNGIEFENKSFSWCGTRRIACSRRVGPGWMGFTAKPETWPPNSSELATKQQGGCRGSPGLCQARGWPMVVVHAPAQAWCWARCGREVGADQESQTRVSPPRFVPGCSVTTGMCFNLSEPRKRSVKCCANSEMYGEPW